MGERDVAQSALRQIREMIWQHFMLELNPSQSTPNLLRDVLSRHSTAQAEIAEANKAIAKLKRERNHANDMVEAAREETARLKAFIEAIRKCRGRDCGSGMCDDDDGGPADYSPRVAEHGGVCPWDQMPAGGA